MYLNNMLCRQDVGIAAIKNFIENSNDIIDAVLKIISLLFISTLQ